MSMTFYPTNCVDGHPNEVNLANANASTVFSSLGISLDPEGCGRLDPQMVLDALNGARPGLAVRAGSDITTPNGARMIDMGLDDSYVSRRYQQIRELAKACIKMGLQISYS